MYTKIYLKNVISEECLLFHITMYTSCPLPIVEIMNPIGIYWQNKNFKYRKNLNNLKHANIFIDIFRVFPFLCVHNTVYDIPFSYGLTNSKIFLLKLDVIYLVYKVSTIINPIVHFVEKKKYEKKIYKENSTILSRICFFVCIPFLYGICTYLVVFEKLNYYLRIINKYVYSYR